MYRDDFHHSAQVSSSKSLLDESVKEQTEMIRKIGIEGLYYITHVDNLVSILSHGILSHRRVVQSGIEFTSIYDGTIISNRESRSVTDSKGLWDFANLYFQPRNAMLYRVLRGKSAKHLAVLFISPEVLSRRDTLITNGNAASPSSEIFLAHENRNLLSMIRNQIDKEWWTDNDGSKRKMMAECLVPDQVPSSMIRAIYVASEAVKFKVGHIFQQSQESDIPNIPVTVDSNMFFQPSFRIQVQPGLSLVKGDMFFSRMQTLTISVNCVGVMGKGLASTAKYRFPDVYVKYQDLCRKKTLRMGVPYVHKRESSIFNELADEASGFEDPEFQTWFLLFPTKQHWKNDADQDGIEHGLQWLVENYRNEGIKSLAMPALGCGLGQLEWKNVGPLMCQYLSQMDIDTSIYLPNDRETPGEYMDSNFLLSRII